MADFGRRRTLALLAGAAQAGPAAPARFQHIPSRERIRQRHFPDLTLTTHEGLRVRLYEELIKDKIVLLNFMYAKCDGVCMPITMNLRRVQDLFGRRIGRDIFINSFTLKPHEDTPEVLRQYATMHRVGPGWNFLTGAADDMELLRRRLGFFDPDPELDRDKSNHLGLIKYGNEPLERWGGCPGMLKPSSIVRAVGWVDSPRRQGGG